MAKIIRYKILSAEINHGTEENPDIEQILIDKCIECKTQADYDANYPIAEMEAVPGTIDPDPEGEFETEQPTQSDRIEAQITYTAMITGTLLPEV